MCSGCMVAAAGAGSGLLSLPISFSQRNSPSPAGLRPEPAAQHNKNTGLPEQHRNNKKSEYIYTTPLGLQEGLLGLYFKKKMKYF